MIVKFDSAFTKSIKKCKNPTVKSDLIKAIEAAERADSIQDIPSVKAMQGKANKGYYRIRIGNYRIGIKLKDGVLCFLTFAHRKEIYRTFPILLLWMFRHHW